MASIVKVRHGSRVNRVVGGGHEQLGPLFVGGTAGPPMCVLALAALC